MAASDDCMMLADLSSEHVCMLLPPLPPKLPTDHASMKAYLMDQGGLRIPVTAQCYRGTHKTLKPLLSSTDDSPLPVLLTGLILEEPAEYHSEMTASVLIAKFFHTTFSSLYKHTNIKLDYELLLNKGNTAAGTNNDVVVEQLRPGAHLVADNCTLMGMCSGSWFG